MRLEEAFEAASLVIILEEIKDLKKYIKEALMATETDLVDFINTNLLPAFAGLQNLGGQIGAGINTLEAQIATLTQELAAAGTPTQVDTQPAIDLLKGLVAQLATDTTQGQAVLNQMTAPVNASNSASSTAPGAAAPGISGAPANVPVSGNASTGTVPPAGA